MSLVGYVIVAAIVGVIGLVGFVVWLASKAPDEDRYSKNTPP